MSRETTSYWNDLGHHQCVDEIWMNHHLVRSRINERISGAPEVWAAEWLSREIAPRLPLRRGLSIGCGLGDLERYLVREGIATTMLGIDLSPAVIAVARATAEAEGLSRHITYIEADAEDYLRGGEVFDAVFFHQSLHHFAQPARILDACRHALVPDGVLYLDEYVGPSRDEWRWYKLWPYNVLYYMLPAEVRRPRLVRRPVNHEDPTEAIASSEILAGLAASFEIVQRRDYGGNVLSVMYPNLERPRDPGNAGERTFDGAVAFLLATEDALLRARWIPGLRSFYTVILATPLWEGRGRGRPGPR